MRLRNALVAFMLACFASVGYAQVQSGNISGAVKDEQGGVLPGVTVTLAGQRTDRRRSSPKPTDSTGS